MTYRLKYSQDICERHYKTFTTNELVYLCQWYGVISSRELAMALGRTQKAIYNKINKMKISGEYEFYKNIAKNRLNRKGKSNVENQISGI